MFEQIDLVVHQIAVRYQLDILAPENARELVEKNRLVDAGMAVGGRQQGGMPLRKGLQRSLFYRLLPLRRDPVTPAPGIKDDVDLRAAGQFSQIFEAAVGNRVEAFRRQ